MGDRSFRGVPMPSPEAVLESHGLDRGKRRVLDLANGLATESWRRTLTSWRYFSPGRDTVQSPAPEPPTTGYVRGLRQLSGIVSPSISR